MMNSSDTALSSYIRANIDWLSSRTKREALVHKD